MVWFVQHRRRDQTIETIQCDEAAKARRLYRELEEANEIAWVEDDRGRTLDDWELANA